MAYRFKDILAAGELCRVFAVGRLLDPVMIDLFALTGGFHGAWLDQEHVGLTHKEVLLGSVACRANGFDCFVRMAPTNYAQVTQNLEAGAGGVMAAQINNVAEAEQFVRWSKFAPRGVRGMNTTGRDAHYTHLDQLEFAERANREHFIAIQIETLGALADAEAIAQIDGVDLLFVGPADLCQAMGLQGQRNHPKVWEGYKAVATACKRHGKHWGTVPADPAAAQRCYDMGCRMISFTGDVPVIKAGLNAVKQNYPGLF